MARYEIAEGSVSFKTPFGGRKKYKAGEVANDIPPESVPWLLGAGIIRPAPSASRMAPRVEPSGAVPTPRATDAGKGSG